MIGRSLESPATIRWAFCDPRGRCCSRGAFTAASPIAATLLTLLSLTPVAADGGLLDFGGGGTAGARPTLAPGFDDAADVSAPPPFSSAALPDAAGGGGRGARTGPPGFAGGAMDGGGGGAG